MITFDSEDVDLEYLFWHLFVFHAEGEVQSRYFNVLYIIAANYCYLMILYYT